METVNLDCYSLLEEIKNKSKGNFFEPYIQYIRFPHYKCLDEDSIINFTFPLTVLVGPNGTNKTSILQALYGCPNHKNVGTYWFSTEVDKIDNTWQHKFIYGYKHSKTKKIVEILKTRISKKENLDYWEPSRPIASLGMEIPSSKILAEAGNTSKTRWDLIDKNVVFIDCKEYISAYDLFFYHSEFATSTRIKSRQQFLRQRSHHLNTVIRKNLQSYTYKNIPKVRNNVILCSKECSFVSYILDKNYSEIQIIEHGLYDRYSKNKPAKTIFLKQDNMEYSEAFAGSGEARVVLLVHDIYTAPKESLVLMDEPEVSLHPSAIEKLKLFTLSMIAEKGLQVIISTHSPTLIHELPNKSIKLLTTSIDGKIHIKEDINYLEAFCVLGEKAENQKRIIVEDRLVEYLINFYLNNYYNNLKEMIVVTFVQGGAGSIITQNVVAAVKASSNSDFFMLDGDKNTLINNKYNDTKDTVIKREWITDGKIDPNKIAPSDDSMLLNIIHELTDSKVKLNHSGGNDNRSQLKIQLERKFLEFWKTNVFFLNFLTPETGILTCLNIDHDKGNAKDWFVMKASEELGRKANAEDIFNLQQRQIKKLPKDCSLFKHINNIINKIIKS